MKQEQDSLWVRIHKRLQELQQARETRELPARDIEDVWRDRAVELAKPAEGLEAPSGEDIPVLIVSIGDEKYGFPLEFLREIQRSTCITKVPNVPAFILGVMNLRGEVVSVLDSAHMLKVKGGGADAVHRRIVIAQVGNVVVGLEVGAVERITMVPPESLRPRIAGGGEGVDVPLKGIVSHQGEVFPLVDLDRLLDPEKIVVHQEA